MTGRAPEFAAAATAVLAAVALAVLVAGSRRDEADLRRAASFQAEVGGLGTGAASTLGVCAASFDRGSGASCDRALDPVPGGTSFCALHSGPSLGR